MGREKRPYICCIDNVQKRSKSEPWGTPKGAWTQADLEEPNVTQFVHSERKELSHSSGLSVRPKDIERRWRRILWSTESNSELTSKRANSETCPASMALWRSDRRRTKRVSVEWFLRNPIGEQGVSHKHQNKQLLAMIRSSILDISETLAIGR